MAHSLRHIKTWIVACAAVFLVVIGCSNEPFTILPLGISAVENTTTNVTSAYTYKNQQVKSFVQTHLGDTIKIMQFHYSPEGILDRIVIDSTEESYSLMKITGQYRMPVKDSLYQITSTAKVLLQTRQFSYASGQQLSKAEVFVYNNGSITKTVYDLEWDAGNISIVRKTTVGAGGATTKTTLLVGHDAKLGIYSSDAAYLYTMVLDDIYWLSTNNPIRFKRDSLKETNYTYFYNTRGYPSHIRTDAGQIIAHTYIELR